MPLRIISFGEQLLLMAQQIELGLESVDAEIQKQLGFREALLKMKEQNLALQESIRQKGIADKVVPLPFELDPPPFPRTDQRTEHISSEPLWRRIARLMWHKSSFTMKDAWLAVEQETGKSLLPNRSQKIRNSLLRHPELFQPNPVDGTYKVINVVTVRANSDTEADV